MYVVLHVPALLECRDLMNIPSLGLQVQGMLRLGDGDMDVNWARNEALLEALHEAQDKGELPAEDSC